MPKSKTIKVVEVAKPDEPIVEQVNEPIDEPVVEQVSEPVDEPVVEAIPEAKPKARAKRQPKSKKEEPFTEPNINVISTIDESVVEVELPKETVKENKKVSDKVQCPDCGKMVSSKSLKYSHVHTCTAKKSKPLHVTNDDKQDDTIEDVKTFEPVNVELPVKPTIPLSHRENVRKLRQERMKLIFAGAI